MFTHFLHAQMMIWLSQTQYTLFKAAQLKISALPSPAGSYPKSWILPAVIECWEPHHQHMQISIIRFCWRSHFDFKHFNLYLSVRQNRRILAFLKGKHHDSYYAFTDSQIQRVSNETVLPKRDWFSFSKFSPWRWGGQEYLNCCIWCNNCHW